MGGMTILILNPLYACAYIYVVTLVTSVWLQRVTNWFHDWLQTGCTRDWLRGLFGPLFRLFLCAPCTHVYPDRQL
jgi:hypothetical protein